MFHGSFLEPTYSCIVTFWRDEWLLSKRLTALFKTTLGIPTSYYSTIHRLILVTLNQSWHSPGLGGQIMHRRTPVYASHRSLESTS
jgi:hypothetical protein